MPTNDFELTVPDLYQYEEGGFLDLQSSHTNPDKQSETITFDFSLNFEPNCSQFHYLGEEGGAKHTADTPTKTFGKVMSLGYITVHISHEEYSLLTGSLTVLDWLSIKLFYSDFEQKIVTELKHI